MDWDQNQLSIHEVALRLGKSEQTIRRMIKKGALPYERTKTPQGFIYTVPSSFFAGNWQATPLPTLAELPIVKEPVIEEKKPIVAHEPAVQEKSPQNEGGELCYKDKMFLIELISRLQRDLDSEKRKPRGFLATLMDFLYST